MKQGLSLLLSLGYGIFSQGIFLNNAIAQVTPDGTTNTRVDVSGNDFTIEQGNRAGGNLFHSFSDFSVPNGGSASFNNAVDVTNIFSRVTGGNISNIDGLLRANGTANLFLINPAGIIFGEGSRLDIGGSFYGSSADSIIFPDGEFSATDLTNPPVLTINAPIGLNLRDNPADITNRSNFGLTEQIFDQERNSETIQITKVTNVTGLAVGQGQNLALIGGNIFLEGGGITAPGGNIVLGGLSQAGQVTIGLNGSLEFPEQIAKADLVLNNSALVNVVSDGGGFININARNVTISKESQLLAGIGEGLGNPDAVAGDIVINASESVTLIGDGELENPEIDLDGGIRNLVGLPPARQSNPEETSTAIGNAGSIFINAELLQVLERADINIRIYGQGNAGDVNINTNRVFLSEAGITSQVRTGGQGNSGNVNFNTNSFNATDFSFVITDHFGKGPGNAGNINLNATDSVVIQGGSRSGAFIATIEEDAIGNAGDININTSSFLISDGNQLLSQAKGTGNGGNVNIIAENNVTINDGADIIVQVLAGGEGDSGDVTITTGSLQLQNGSTILADTKGVGDAGDVVIQADETILIEGNGTEILTNVAQDALGNAGDINIIANSLLIRDGADVKAQTDGEGNAGNINISIEDSISLDKNGSILGQVTSSASGDGGLINIATNNLSITEESTLSVDNQGQGNAGNIIVNSNAIQLDNNASITGTTVTGQGGNIQLAIDGTIDMRNNSLISSEAQGDANGGNITIGTDFIVAFPNQNNDILASANQGQGGNINITAEALFGIAERSSTPPNQTNDIDASSEFGLDGNVSIVTPDINRLQTDIELPNSLIEAEQTVTQACQSNRFTDQPSGLTLKGKGGVSPLPTAPLDSETILVEGEIIPANIQAKYPEIKPIATSNGNIYPARGILKTQKGKIILTAYTTDSLNNRTPNISANCSSVSQY